MRPDYRTLLSALGIVFALPPWDLSWLAWVLFVPWFFSLEKASTETTRSWRKTLAQGFWLSFGMNVIGAYWVAYSIHENGGLPWALSVPAFLLWAWVGEPQFIGFALAYKALRPLRERSRMLWVLALALGYSAIDWLLPKLFVDTIGHAFYRAENLRQVADLGGAFVLSSLVILVNLGIWCGKFFAREKGWRRYREAFLGIALVSAAWGYGVFRLEQVRQHASRPEGTVRAAIVQGNIGNMAKLDSERGVEGANLKVLNTYLGLSQGAKADFVVWPETSYPSHYKNPRNPDEKKLDELLAQFVASSGMPLVFGGYDHEGWYEYNGLFYLNPSGDFRTYRKNKLLFFGEYVPGAQYFPFVQQLLPHLAFFGRGVGPEVVSIALRGHPGLGDSLRTSPLICYEVLFPDFVIESVRKGSQLLFNVTNDSWFGPWSEPYLHLALSVFRSIETRTPLLRATNTGVTAIVGIDGEITHRTRVDEQTVLNAEIPITRPMPTLMLLWGDWFGPFCFAALGLALLTSRLVAARKRQ